MTLERRLGKLQTVWPLNPCTACVSRPPVVCIKNADDPAPHYPEGTCCQCGRILITVPVIIGIDCDDL